MKLSTIITSGLFAATILAAPHKKCDLNEQKDGMLRRDKDKDKDHHSDPPKILRQEKVTKGNNITNVVYSNNWAGAVLTSPPAGQTFTSVGGTFTVPTPSFPNGQPGTYAASIWVGIDGATYANAILQVGVDLVINSDGTQSYSAWYEWYPAVAQFFTAEQFSFKPGDVITIAVAANDPSHGEVALENHSTGQGITQAVTAPSSSAVLAGQNAEWIVEDYQSGNSLVSFANFGSILFSSCLATTKTETLGIGSASLFDIEDANGVVLTNVGLPSSSEVAIVYG